MAPQSLCQGFGEVPHCPNVNRNVVFLRRTGQSEWMVLPYRDLRTAEEDVLSSSHLRVLLLDLDLHDIARVLNDF